MKILCILPHYPIPTDCGDKRRNLAVLKELSMYHDVAVATLLDGAPSSMPAEGEPSWAVHSVNHTCAKLLPALVSFCTLRTYREAKFYSRALQQVIDNLLDTNGYDAVWIGQINMSIYLRSAYKRVAAGVHPPLLILDQHNEEESFWESFAKNLRSPLLRGYSLLEKYKNRALQRRCFPMFDYIISVSEEDRLRTVNNYGCDGSKVLLGSNGVDIEYFSPVEPKGNSGAPPVIVFGGSLDVTMNHDAICWFIEKVLPLVRKRMQVQLHVVGRNPKKEVMSKQSEDILIYPNVPDVREYYKNADVFIVPLLSGGGTKLKTIEAMSMALPVVTTSVGVQGLGVTSGKQCFVADSVEDFAARTIQLLEDRELASQFRQNARRHVVDLFSWSSTLSPIRFALATKPASSTLTASSVSEASL